MMVKQKNERLFDMEYALQTKEVSKSFRKKLAVNSVSISVRAGDIYGFIGENGAGKTTLMRMVVGLAAPSGGGITLFESKDFAAGRRKIGTTIENPALYPAMTAMENMEAQRILLNIKDKKVCKSLLEIVGLADTGKKKAKDFSLGMKQRLMIALALLGDPEFLVLDEPTNGLDPMGIMEVRDLFQKLNESRGITILVSSHILGELEKIATRYGVISGGKLIDEFRADELNLRCGENLLIRVDDPAKAKEVVANTVNNPVFLRAPDKAVRIKGHTENAERVNEALVKSGVKVSALVPEGEHLEDYFMRLMRGERAGENNHV